MALQLGKEWSVVKSDFKGEPPKLGIELDFKTGTQFCCAGCKEKSPVHDTEIKQWRHLNFWQYETVLSARVPRTKCEQCGVKLIEVPWARKGSGFTLMFEAFAMLLMKESPVSKVSQVLMETDKRLWRILIHYVNEAHAKKDWSQCTRILVDETSARRGHRYVTSFLDALTGEILLMVEGKSHETIAEFVKEMRLHGSSPEQVQWIGIDMSPAFKKGVRDCFPHAEIVFDRFHVMQLAGKMLDEIRKAIHRQLGLVKGARRALMGNEWNLNDEQYDLRKELCRLYPALAKAMEIRDRLQDVYEEKSESLLKQLYHSASRCKNNEIKKLARSIKEHWDGIVGFFKTNLSNGKIEAINGIIQLAKRNARGFRDFEYLRAISYLRCSKLQLNLPTL